MIICSVLSVCEYFFRKEFSFQPRRHITGRGMIGPFYVRRRIVTCPWCVNRGKKDDDDAWARDDLGATSSSSS